MPDNTINWGQGAVENTNDWGKGKTNSANNWGKVYETSPSGDTNIEGGLALSITYSASAYCDGIGDTPQPTVANNTGSGTFSSTSGIIFADSGSNTGSSTGVIDVDASTKGATYVITYTDTDSDTATANVTLNALDNAAFAYSASSYEPTDADPTPTITGLTGGTFSSTSGLVFVDSGTNTGSSTGEIDLSATTEATYTITYDTTSSGSSVCPNTSTQSVEVAVAAISNNFSMSLDGTSAQRINISSVISSISSSSTGSISLWVKPESSAMGGWRDIISFASNTVNRTYLILYKSNTETAYLQFRDNGNQMYQLQTNAAVFSVNTWVHIVITQNGTEPEIYINGSKPAQTFLSGTISTKQYWWSNISSFNTSNIGAMIWDNGGTEMITDGAGVINVDEVGIWNTALSSTQVQSIYDATGTNLTKDLTTVSGSNLVYFNRMGD